LPFNIAFISNLGNDQNSARYLTEIDI